MKILVGTDPELFMKKDNALVSAYGMIPGSKDKPHPVKHGAVQVDGMALEFNIDPADTADMFNYNIVSVLDQLKAMIPEHEFNIEPVAEFGKELIASQPDEARLLGCDPDYNAWTGEENRPPNVDAPFRTAAGHVHIGWTKGEDVTGIMHNNMVRDLIIQLDFFLGLPSLMYDKATKRRELYGKAGAYRTKPYGAEYRVLSNKWITSEELRTHVFNNTQLAIDRLMKGDKLVERQGNIQHTINNSRVDVAKAILEEEGIPYVL